MYGDYLETAIISVTSGDYLKLLLAMAKVYLHAGVSDGFILYVGGSQPFYHLEPLGHFVLSTRTTSSRTPNLIES